MQQHVKAKYKKVPAVVPVQRKRALTEQNFFDTISRSRVFPEETLLVSLVGVTTVVN